MMKPEEILRPCSANDPAFEGDEPYKVSPSSFYEVDEDKEARIDAIAGSFLNVIRSKTGECWLCGKADHEGQCVLDDEYWAKVEAGRLEWEAKNECALCGKYSLKSVEHDACTAQANAELDNEKYAEEKMTNEEQTHDPVCVCDECMPPDRTTYETGGYYPSPRED